MRYLIFPIFFLAIYFFNSTIVKDNFKRPFFAPPSAEIKHFTFGNNEVIASSLWLRLVQDIDFCGEEYSKVIDLPTERAKPPDIRQHKCTKGWSFQMLDSITELSPKFRMAFLIGGMVLTVAADDKDGASIIFDKGIQNFPKDGYLLFNAGYHFMDEVGDNKKAADLLVRAGNAEGAPYWVYQLAAKLYTKEGQALLGLSVLEGYLKTYDKDRKGYSYIKKRYDELLEQVKK